MPSQRSMRTKALCTTRHLAEPVFLSSETVAPGVNSEQRKSKKAIKFAHQNSIPACTVHTLGPAVPYSLPAEKA